MATGHICKPVRHKLKESIMRAILITSFILFSLFSFSQELNFGGIIGTGPKINKLNILTFGGTIEYRPNKALISLNSDPILLVYNKEIMLTVPLYLKLIIGNKIRFCPTIGGFVRTNANFGLITGLNIDYKINKKLLIFVKGDFTIDYWKDEAPSHFGSSYEYTNSDSSIWISLGIKKNILK